MSDERWDRLKAVFQGALAQPREQRRAWLELACGGDKGLLQEADTLLQSLDSAGDFLEHPADVDIGDSQTFPPGSTIGPYRIERDIGRGGMGVVYLAEDVRLERRVALKALPPEVAANPELRQRLRREARAAATIAHPAVATVYALEEIDEYLFIVSEYVDGETLRESISRGPMEPGRLRGIAIQIARALCAAHEAGVVHRDLKPENVLLTAAGDVKVVDFGIAYVEGREGTKLTRAGAMLGTPAYMAPEQLLGTPVDGRADIYAFGVLLNELATGHHPLAAVTAPATPPMFAAIIARCMQPDPSARYASGRDLLAALEATRPGPADGVAGPAEAGLYGRGPAEAGLYGGGPAEAGLYGAGPAEAGLYDRTVGGEAHRLRQVESGFSRTTSESGVSRTTTDSGFTGTSGSARWWWEFHQAAAASVYWLMVLPAWRARELLGSPWGRTFFIVTLVSVIVAANLRLNLWFTSRFYPAELRWTRRRVGRWIRAADWVFAITLTAGGLAIGDEGSAIAVLLISVAIGSVVAFLVIERVTTRAAFRTLTTPGSSMSR
jgi:predicted Ser/Thr protein kinase